MNQRPFSITLFGLLFAISGSTLLPADDDILDDLEKAKTELTRSEYLLRYKYQPGETIQYQVEQLVAIDTTIERNNKQTKLRTKSTRSFEVQDVSDDGNMKFAHRILRMEMWNEETGREAVHYDSDSDAEPPAAFAGINEKIGEPISVITLSPLGAVVERDNRFPHPDIGLGGLSIPLPEAAIPVGHQWYQPMDIKVQLPDKRIKVIKTREVYQLEKVATGVASISIKTQILTPINDSRVKAQIIQRISKGEMRFDVDAGRLLSKQLDFNEVVLGFNGSPDSKMKYLARLSEAIEKQEVARKPAKRTTSASKTK